MVDEMVFSAAMRAAYSRASGTAGQDPPRTGCTRQLPGSPVLPILSIFLVCIFGLPFRRSGFLCLLAVAAVIITVASGAV